MKFVLALTVALGILASCTPANASDQPVADPHPDLSGEYRVRQSITQDVADALYRRQFDQLKVLESSFLKSGARTPSGVMKIEVFNRAPASVFGPIRSPTCDDMADEWLDAWMKAQPTAPAPVITKASRLIDEAFCFRGPEAAANVSDDAWEKFHAKLGEAQQLLDAHRAMASANPGYYVAMESLYLGQGRSPDEFRALLDEATKRFPLYLPIYDQAYTYLKPQWFGAAGDEDALANYMDQRFRRVDGEGGYARFYWSAAYDHCSCWRDNVDWPKMKASMAALTKSFPDPWNVAAMARVACEADDAETAKLYFAKLGEHDGSEQWNGDTEAWRKCRTMAGY